MADLIITEADRKRLLHAYETLCIRALEKTSGTDERIFINMAMHNIKAILTDNYDGSVLDKTHHGDSIWPDTDDERIEAFK